MAMRTGVSKGGVFGARERGFQRPFGLFLLVLFLQEQEKYMTNHKGSCFEERLDKLEFDGEAEMDINCKQCAINCVGGETLKQYQKQFDECNQDFDSLFSSDTGDEDFYRSIIEPGHIYETGYPRCICWRNDDGKDKCECSRQAIIYLYSQLLPNSEITAEIIQTVRTGAENCRFRIILGK